MRRALLYAMLATVGCAGFVAPARTHAQEEVSLAEIVRFARERSPRARALRAEVDVADAEIGLAGVYPNPRLSYVGMGRMNGNASAINGTQHQVWLDVPLLVAGQHHARRDAAAAGASAVRAELEVALLALEMGARRAFVALLVAQERTALLIAARDELVGLDALVAGRASAGAQSAYDAARVRIAVAQLDVSLAGARADERAAAVSLATTLGRPGWSPRAAGVLDAGTRPFASLAARNSPAIEAARRRVEAAQRDVERAERERVPEIALGVGACMTTDGGSSSAYLGVSVPLPIFDTGSAAVRRAQAGREQAVRARTAVEQERAAALRGAIDVLRARREALSAFSVDVAARVPELQAMAESAYRLGASGVFELLDAFEARRDLTLARIDVIESALAAELDVLSIVGSE